MNGPVAEPSICALASSEKAPAVRQDAAVVDPDHPGMTYAVQDGRFLHDPRRHAGLAAQIRVHDLECSMTRQDGMSGFVYRGHSPATDLSHDAIRTHQGVSA